MDTSYLSQQVNTIVGQLHGLFDEIGVPSHDREAREAELFAALSETLQNQVRQVAAEKKGMVDEAQHIIANIRQMEVSLDDSRSRRDHPSEGEDLRVSYPLTRCLQLLQEKQAQLKRIHKERYEQVKKLVQALESYSSHLESTFVKIALPPTGPNQSVPASFDLSPTYVDKLDQEFTRVYDEYGRRIDEVRAICEQIIQLWAELGTPQAQTDPTIVKHYRDTPEQLGLHADDLARLRAKRDKLGDEKKSREKKLRDLKSIVEGLWDKLGIEEAERKAFLNGNRGCGVRQINEFEDELGRLNELKQQNLHLFVEDARTKLQALWDSLYFSEDEMLEFTPAFSDVYSDALLEAHERELSRLQDLKEQRAPVLALVDRHKHLTTEQKELSASSQDASRLMLRGQKGEKRDPGKLLREEKMRKRIAKELPKVAAELRKILEKWEDEWARPFLVYGERYLDAFEDSEPRAAPGPRSKTPASAPVSTATLAKSAPPSRANSIVKPASRAGAKTPTPHHFVPAKKAGHQSTVNPRGSPSKIPARAPLSSLPNGNNSPERARPQSRNDARGKMGPPLRAPPPKMRDLKPVPELQTPMNRYAAPATSPSVVRATVPEDVYDDRAARPRPAYAAYDRPASQQQQHQQYQQPRQQPSYEGRAGYAGPMGGAPPPQPRQISNNSNSTAVTGSENWETYDDNSDAEQEASDAYYAAQRRNGAAVQQTSHHHQYQHQQHPSTLVNKGKRASPADLHDYGHQSRPQMATPYAGGGGGGAHGSKRLRGMPMAQQGVQYEGTRVGSASEWTDEDAF